MTPCSIESFEIQTGTGWEQIRRPLCDAVRKRGQLTDGDPSFYPGVLPFTHLGGARWRVLLCYELDFLRPGDEIFDAVVEFTLDDGGGLTIDACRWNDRFV